MNEIGRSMPWLDREIAYEEMWRILRVLQTRKSADRTEWPIPAVIGAPGCGKTRFMAEAIRHPHPSVAQFFPNLATSTSLTTTEDFAKTNGAQHKIAVRLLYHYFIEEHSAQNTGLIKDSVDLVLQQFSESRINLNEALRHILCHIRHTRGLKDNEPLNLVISIDEFNKVAKRTCAN
jgi:hypothetical protein